MPEDQTPGQLASAEISCGAVQLVREYTGRGPSKARTIIETETVAIVLADNLTRGEPRLVANG